jgi:hypothetical protein
MGVASPEALSSQASSLEVDYILLQSLRALVYPELAGTVSFEPMSLVLDICYHYYCSNALANCFLQTYLKHWLMMRREHNAFIAYAFLLHSFNCPFIYFLMVIITLVTLLINIYIFTIYYE